MILPAKIRAVESLCGVSFVLALLLGVLVLKNSEAQALPVVSGAVDDSVCRSVYEVSSVPAIVRQEILLSEAHLKVPNDPGGLRNAALAAKKINGTIVQPGAVFSFNRVVGERT